MSASSSPSSRREPPNGTRPRWAFLAALSLGVVQASLGVRAAQAAALAAGASPLPAEVFLSAPFPSGTEYRVSCDYFPCNPAHAGTNDPNGVNDHYALDLTVNARGNGHGAAVTAAAAGTVVFAGWGQGRMSIYGQNVLVAHPTDQGKVLHSFYAHLHTVAVQPGQQVRAKDPIGTLGGSSRGRLDALAPHLHFAVYEDPTLDDGPKGGRAVRPEPLDGNTGIGLRQVLTAGDGTHEALYVVVDDLSRGFAAGPEAQIQSTASSAREQWMYGTEDTWTASTGYGPRARHLVVPSSSGGRGPVATWQHEVPWDGPTRIEVFVPRSSRSVATSAAYSVQVGTQAAECHLDQTRGQGGWVTLCEGRVFPAAKTDSLTVELLRGPSTQDEALLLIDAIRFLRAAPPDAP